LIVSLRLALKNSKEESLKCRFSSNWRLSMESSFKAVRRPESNRVPCNACTVVWTPEGQSSACWSAEIDELHRLRGFGGKLQFVNQHSHISAHAETVRI
jgi:hypothetical protein